MEYESENTWKMSWCFLIHWCVSILRQTWETRTKPNTVLLDHVIFHAFECQLICDFFFLIFCFDYGICNLILILDRQADVRISPSTGTCFSDCWLLGMLFDDTLVLILVSLWISHCNWVHNKFFQNFLCWIQLSYIVVDLLIWWGIRGHINDFRKRKLKLAPIAYFSTYHGSISHLPTGYMWSPHVVPKPSGEAFCLDVVISDAFEYSFYFLLLLFYIVM